MKIKKVDDKPMVIYTKQKANIHTHEPKQSSIKGSNIYTVDRDPTKKKVAEGSYRKSTVHKVSRLVFCSGFIHNRFHVICNNLIWNAAKGFKRFIKKGKEFILRFREKPGKPGIWNTKAAAQKIYINRFPGKKNKRNGFFPI